jgi:hypothetical protein
VFLSFAVGSDPSTSQSTASLPAHPSGSQFIIIPPTPELIQELLAFQITMLSCKAAQMEIMNWEGMTAEDFTRYIESVGVKDERCVPFYQCFVLIDRQMY